MNKGSQKQDNISYSPEQDGDVDSDQIEGELESVIFMPTNDLDLNVITIPETENCNSYNNTFSRHTKISSYQISYDETETIQSTIGPKTTSIESDSGPNTIFIESEIGPNTTSIASDTGPKTTSIALETGPKTISIESDSGPNTIFIESEIGPKTTSIASEISPKTTSAALETGPKATTIEPEFGPVAPEVTTEQNIGHVISIPSESIESKDNEGHIIRIPSNWENPKSNNSVGQIIRIQSNGENPKSKDLEYGYGQVIDLPLSSRSEECEGQIITIIHEETVDSQSNEECGYLDPETLNALSQHKDIRSEDGSPLSFIALVPGTDSCVTEKTEESFVALIPDSTHYAPPISSQEEDGSMTLKEITARERSKLIKRAQRENVEFRERERKRGRLSMKDRRKDPEYREMERKRDRERRRLARQMNAEQREKERERDREYRRRLKIGDFNKSAVNETESPDSLECFMKDIDEKCQLLINCKGDESSNEDIVYNLNTPSVFNDTLLGSTDQNETISQFGHGELQSEILLQKETKQNYLKTDYPLGSTEIT